MARSRGIGAAFFLPCLRLHHESNDEKFLVHTSDQLPMCWGLGDPQTLVQDIVRQSRANQLNPALSGKKQACASVGFISVFLVIQFTVLFCISTLKSFQVGLCVPWFNPCFPPMRLPSVSCPPASPTNSAQGRTIPSRLFKKNTDKINTPPAWWPGSYFCVYREGEKTVKKLPTHAHAPLAPRLKRQKTKQPPTHQLPRQDKTRRDGKKSSTNN